MPPHIRPLDALPLSSMREPEDIVGRTWLGAIGIVLMLGTPVVAAEKTSTLPGCAQAAKNVFSSRAQAVLDGMTLRLEDGRTVRLAGIVASDDGAAGRARRALEEIARGKRLRVYAATDKTDRYGRVVAQVTTEGGSWLQGALVHAGAAHVMPGSGDPDCAKELLALEHAARSAGAGVWRGADLSVNRLRRKFAEEGRFVVIEDVVHRIGESGGRLFLDFGPKYWEDFTIVIPPDAQAGFAEAGVDLRDLSGTRVRARGVLFSWGGPAMELRVPAALELVGTDAQ